MLGLLNNSLQVQCCQVWGLFKSTDPRKTPQMADGDDGSESLIPRAWAMDKMGWLLVLLHSEHREGNHPSDS